jgi:hypothetical protein
VSGPVPQTRASLRSCGAWARQSRVARRKSCTRARLSARMRGLPPVVCTRTSGLEVPASTSVLAPVEMESGGEPMRDCGSRYYAQREPMVSGSAARMEANRSRGAGDSAAATASAGALGDGASTGANGGGDEGDSTGAMALDSCDAVTNTSDATGTSQHCSKKRKN